MCTCGISFHSYTGRIDRKNFLWLGNAFRCQTLTHSMLDGELVLDDAVLKAANGNVQQILDCLSPASKLLVAMKEVPTNGGWTINKPITIESKDSIARLMCSPEGIEIKYVRGY